MGYAMHILLTVLVAQLVSLRLATASHFTVNAHNHFPISGQPSWRTKITKTYPYRSIFGELIYPPIPMSEFHHHAMPVPILAPLNPPQLLRFPPQRNLVAMVTTPLPVPADPGNAETLGRAVLTDIVPKVIPKETTTTQISTTVTEGNKSLRQLFEEISFNGQGILPSSTGNTIDFFTANKELQRLFESAAQRLRSPEDEDKLKHHLIMLNEIQLQKKAGDNFSMMEKQLNYIQTIPEPIIRREVLKIFVKDIVEKSGVMNSGLAGAADIGTVNNLLNIIDKITKDLEAKATSTKADTSVFGRTTAAMPNELSKTSEVAERIAKALVDLSRQPAKVNLADMKTISGETFARLTNFRGRGPSRLETSSVVGLSIFGEKVEPKVTVTTAKTTTESFIRREMAGGSSVYWSSLQSSLGNLLCALCQEQNNTGCIRRFCSNQTVGTTTRSPR